MCVVICHDNGKVPSEEVLKACQSQNSNGIGVAWKSEKGIEYRRGISFEKLLKCLKQIERDKAMYIAHFRFATQGDRNDKTLTHPFPISTEVSKLRDLKGVTEEVLAHNGTWSEWRSHEEAKGKILKGSDSMFMAFLVAKGYYFTKEHLRWNKVVTLSAKSGLGFMGNWAKDDDGIAFSNMGWKSHLYRKTTYSYPTYGYASGNWPAINQCKECTFTEGRHAFSCKTRNLASGSLNTNEKKKQAIQNYRETNSGYWIGNRFYRYDSTANTYRSTQILQSDPIDGDIFSQKAETLRMSDKQLDHSCLGRWCDCDWATEYWIHEVNLYEDEKDIPSDMELSKDETFDDINVDVCRLPEKKETTVVERIELKKTETLEERKTKHNALHNQFSQQSPKENNSHSFLDAPGRDGKAAPKSLTMDEIFPLDKKGNVLSNQEAEMLLKKEDVVYGIPAKKFWRQLYGSRN